MKRFAILSVLAVPVVAFAGEPLITDDPGVADAGTFQLKVAYEGQRTPQGWTHELPDANLEYGIVKDMSMTVEVPFVVTDPKGEAAFGAMGESQVEWKWNFLHKEEVGVEVSFAPKIQLNNPLGSNRLEKIEDGTSIILPVQIGRNYESWEWFAEVGYEFVQYQKNAMDAGVAVGYFVMPKLELLAELHTDTDSYFNDNSPVAQVGVTWEFAEKTTLLAAAGRSLRSRADDPTFLTYVGVEWEF